ncbi:LCP family protein [Streptomyces sp. NPDC001941]|uniref:LCP family protein n=1 Tax=Streptomyces sp. NPDC001941 TaxID=3154659 RepID=UPI00331D9D74
MTTDHQAVAPGRLGGAKLPGARRGPDKAQRQGGEPAKPRRLRVALAIALSVVILAVAGIGWLYVKLTGNINTFGADGIADDRPGDSKGQNVLVIGSDARTGGNSDLGGGDKGDIGRSDTAFLLHVYADHKHAMAVSIPRDTLVTIPSCRLPDGTWTKEQPRTMFNEAYSVGQTAKGNPACTQNTVEKLTGLRVDHTVVVDFKGFADLTDVVGGVQVCLPKDVYQRDLNPNLRVRGDLLFPKGEQTLAGQRALDYVRIRHGIGDGSDIGRIKRQQAFMSSLIKKIKDDGFTPTKLLPLAEAATKSMTVDPGLGSADKLLDFAMSLKDIDLHNTKFLTIPWRYEGERVAVVEPDAQALWQTLRDDRTLDGTDASGKNGPKKATSPAPTPTPTKPAPGEGTQVTVLNGTHTTGLAARAAASLRAHDYTVVGTGNADRRDFITTVIRYGAGRQARADALATLFPGARVEAMPEPGLRLIVGSSYTGETAPTAPSTPADLSKEARSADDNPCENLSYG